MNALVATLSNLAALAANVTPDDLQDLALMHDELQALGSSPGVRESRTAAASSTRLEGIVEQLILRKVSDTDAAVAELQTGIEELRSWVASAMTAPTVDLGSREGVDPSESSGSTWDSGSPVAQGLASAGTAVKVDEKTGASAVLCEDQELSGEDVPLVHEFVAEAYTHIETAEASVLRLEDDPRDVEAINAVFRSFHTVKGVAGFLNLKQIGQLTHTTETLLDLLRTGKMELTSEVLEIILCAIDALKTLVGRVADAAKTTLVLKADPSIYGLIEVTEACSQGRPVSGDHKAGSTAKALSAAAGYTNPAVETTASTVANKDVHAVAAAAGASALLPAPDKAQDKTGATQDKSGTAAESMVKVSTTRLDNLINTVGELVIAQAMVAQGSKALLSGEPRLARDLTQMGKITRELQELSMSMRMVPIQGVFQKMSRLVRDLAKKTGKEIELALEGGDTELDRNLVDAITDPLVHMVRNSADHGVETPDERVKSGKPRTGKIVLRAYHQGGSIVIEIKDDGRGLNKAKLLKKAVSAGIVAEGATLSESEIFKLIFHAGLSTAEKVTDVSGRGVGMDVVKRNVESLRGRIDIASVEGSGATFSIRLPLTLAVIDGLVVKVGNERYILPILSVEQSLRPTTDQLSSIQGRGEMCMVRDSLLPLHHLHRLLNVAGANENPTDGIVVIVQDDARRCCILVDELLGQQQVVIKSLGDGVGHVTGFSGGAILGDGNVSLILDIPGLLDLAATAR